MAADVLVLLTLALNAGAGNAPARGNPLRLEQETRVIVDTNATPAGVGLTNAPVQALRLTAAWRGWDGLYLELDQRTPLANPTNLLGGYQYSPGSDVRYQSRPESYLAPIVIDTGNLAARQATAVDLEAAYVNGPFSVQGEFIQSFVLPNSGGRLNFGGFYAEASWYLTGESRPYDAAAGAFQRLIPRRDFHFGKGGGWGAWELAARVSHTDLDSGDVQGGKLNLLMAGVNWYLNPHVKWMFNYGMGRVSGVWDGDMFIFETRVGVDF